MPNILKRPMFKNGSSAQGTGVTSGLDRQKALIDYVSQLKRQAQPTTRQRIGDFLTAFGASKGLDLGASLADTGKNFAALSAKRQDRADKYAAALDSQLLKLFGSSEALTAASKNAREFARLNYKDYPGKTDQEKYMAAYRTQLNRILNKEKAATSFSERVLKIKDDLRKEDVIPSSYRFRTARILARIEDGKIKDKAGNVIQNDGFIGVDDRGLSDIIAVSEEIFQINPKVKGVMESDYVIGNNYLDPKTGGIFRYEGRKKFRKVYP
jgi:hypothetical protein